MNRNPWIDQHVGYEMDHVGGEYTARRARRAVMSEYAHGPAPMPCDCGGTAYYRATVGVRKCTDCGTLYRGNGAPVRKVADSAHDCIDAPSDWDAGTITFDPYI